MTAAMLVGLTALSAFVVDYGILWLARRRVQNAADAAALAAASSLAFDEPDNAARAEANARSLVEQNPVWGTTDPTVVEVTFPDPCPGGGVGVGPCVRVNAYRDQARGAALPTIFGRLVGVDGQGVRATATAQVLYGDHSECVRPLAIPDKWVELNPLPLPWAATEVFYGYNAGTPVANPDAYGPPTIGGVGGAYSNGSGFSRSIDYGQSLHLLPTLLPVVVLNDARAGQERFVPVRISAGSSGAAGFLNDLTSCSQTTVRPGDTLTVEQVDVSAETADGANTLIALDPGASWDASLNDGLGGVAGGCMASGECVVSPRVILVPAFNPDAWDQALPAATSVVVTRLVGLFIDSTSGSLIRGHYMIHPEVPRFSMIADPASSFLVSVALIR